MKEWFNRLKHNPFMCQMSISLSFGLRRKERRSQGQSRKHIRHLPQLLAGLFSCLPALAALKSPPPPCLLCLRRLLAVVSPLACSGRTPPAQLLVPPQLLKRESADAERTTSHPQPKRHIKLARPCVSAGLRIFRSARLRVSAALRVRMSACLSVLLVNQKQGVRRSLWRVMITAMELCPNPLIVQNKSTG